MVGKDVDGNLCKKIIRKLFPSSNSLTTKPTIMPICALVPNSITHDSIPAIYKRED